MDLAVSGARRGETLWVSTGARAAERTDLLDSSHLRTGHTLYTEAATLWAVPAVIYLFGGRCVWA